LLAGPVVSVWVRGMARSGELPAGFFAPNRPCDVGALARFEIPFRLRRLFDRWKASFGYIDNAHSPAPSQACEQVQFWFA